jgi:ribosomal-protein-alanine N-acetyltransferase
MTTTTQHMGFDAPLTLGHATAQLRAAGRRDWHVICRLECACFGRKRLLFGLWPRTGRPGVRTWIAELNGSPVGYLICYASELEGRRVPYVGGIGVLPAFRQLGIATQLMRAVLAATPALWLHVRADNRAALNLYRKLNMRALRRMARFYSNGDDAIVMVTRQGTDL